MSGHLTAEQQERYVQDGFLVLEDLISEDQVVALRERVTEYTHGGRPVGSLQIHSEPRVLRGELSVRHPGDGIRKIDGLVQGDRLFGDLGLHPRLVGVMQELVGPDLKMFRNSLLLKPPEVGSPKGWHQDSPYWPIEPMALCSCWLPLEEATEENGCMVVIPGLHTRGALPHQEVTDDFVIVPEALELSQARPVPMRAGSGLFFHSLLPHYTAPNRSKLWRRAIVLTYMSAQSRYTGPEESPEYFPVCGRSYPGCIR